MVEFIAKKRIGNTGNKVLVVEKTSAFASLLHKNEQILLPALKKQTASNGIKTYDIGTNKVFAVVVQPKMSALEWQQLGGRVYQNVRNCSEVRVEMPSNTQHAYDFAFGMELSSYSFDKYFTQKPKSYYPQLEKVIFGGLSDFSEYKNKAGLANAVRYARDLTNEPANYLTPEVFATDIKRLEYLGLEVEILDEAALKEKGFGLLLAVAQGSCNSPRVAVMKWRGNKDSDEFKIGLVGKGVTFDTGGISIKRATDMGNMKHDMGGAGAVVATMKSLALQKSNKNVVAVISLVENMVSGNAYRPGDIIRSMSGQTVEIVNTDGEGRLVLADCLTYIQNEFNPEYIVDVATLTGAIHIALGNVNGGLFCNVPSLTNKLISAGNESGELLWHMPMGAEYDKFNDSNVADMKNTGGIAGASTAAAFLSRYVHKSTKWAHLDISNVKLIDTPKPLYPKGASGFGVMLLNRFINQI